MKRRTTFLYRRTSTEGFSGIQPAYVIVGLGGWSCKLFLLGLSWRGRVPSCAANITAHGTTGPLRSLGVAVVYTDPHSVFGVLILRGAVAFKHGCHFVVLCGERAGSRTQMGRVEIRLLYP